MTVAEDLREAARLVREGWCQGWFWQKDMMARSPVKVCAIGALMETAGQGLYSDQADSPRWREAYRMLREVVPQAYCLGQWNDLPWQTAENVALTMEHAAKVWERREQAKAEDAAIQAILARIGAELADAGIVATLEARP